MALPEFDQPRQTLGWAREAVNELNAAAIGYFAAVETVTFTDVDPGTGHKHLKVRLKDRLPGFLSRKASEALLNAKHSFDLSLYAACVAIKQTPKRDSHFPWATDPEDLKQLLTGKKGKWKIPPELWDVLRQQEPYFTGEGYTGGNNLVRQLAKIANNKHSIGVSVVGHVTGGVHPTARGQRVEYLGIPRPTWDAKKDEMTLAIYSGDVEFENNYQFAFQIVFKDPKTGRPPPMEEGLAAFLGKAQTALEALEARAVEIRSS